jgi:hypothetical protein
LEHRDFRKIALIDPVAIAPWGSPFFSHVKKQLELPCDPLPRQLRLLLEVTMNELPRLPFLRSTIVSTVVLILALGLTRLSFAYQGYEQVNAGNLCGVDQDEPCIVSVRTAGWPLPYMVDQLGTSAMGVLGFEDFLIVTFLLDLLFYALLLGGIGLLLSRMCSGKLFWAPIAIAIGALTGFVLNSAVTDPAVGAQAVNCGVILGGSGALLALCGTLVLWNDMNRPFARTLLAFLLMSALPGLVCGLFAGGLFGTILQPK